MYFSLETLREKIKRLLIETKYPLSVEEIALSLSLDPRDKDLVYEHLKHIAKTIRRESQGKLVLYMLPPKCRNCGYIFKNLDKPRKPSKCPKCRSQRIDSPKFIIEEV